MSGQSAPTPDPLAAIRADLVAAAGRRRAARRRRRRGAAIASVAVAGVLGAAAATAGIGGHGTGVPVLDDVLENVLDRHEARRPPAAGRGGREVAPRPGDRPRRGNMISDLRPGPGGASAPLTLPPVRPGARPGVAAAYVDRNGYVCFVKVSDVRRPDRGGVGCTMGKHVWRSVRQRPAFITAGGGYGPRSAAHVGFARRDVTAVRVVDPRGRAVTAVLGEPWKPQIPGARPLRPFVAVFAIDPSARRIAAFMPRGLTATLADGRVVEIDGYTRRRAPSRRR